MKRRAASALVLGALLLLAGSGCRGQGKHEEPPLRIGVAVYKGDDTYISNMTAAMQESVEAWSKENGERVYLTISDAGESQTTQNEQIDRFLWEVCSIIPILHARVEATILPWDMIMTDG